VAQADAELTPRWALQRFDCVLGTRLPQQKRPALTRLFRRVLADTVYAWEPLKAGYDRPRPAAVDPTAPICEPRVPMLVNSPSYPAGHAAAGRAWAMALAQVDPERAAEILKRGDEIGDSRLVCGLHWTSDVAAGRVLGEAVAEAERADPAFQADLEAARAELKAARESGLTDAACPAETAALNGR
jgi:acid phosphatase (class A)